MPLPGWATPEKADALIDTMVIQPSSLDKDTNLDSYIATTKSVLRHLPFEILWASWSRRLQFQVTSRLLYVKPGYYRDERFGNGPPTANPQGPPQYVALIAPDGESYDDKLVVHEQEAIIVIRPKASDMDRLHLLLLRAIGSELNARYEIGVPYPDWNQERVAYVELEPHYSDMPEFLQQHEKLRESLVPPFGDPTSEGREAAWIESFAHFYGAKLAQIDIWDDAFESAPEWGIPPADYSSTAIDASVQSLPAGVDLKALKAAIERELVAVGATGVTVGKVSSKVTVSATIKQVTTEFTWPTAWGPRKGEFSILVSNNEQAPGGRSRAGVRFQQPCSQDVPTNDDLTKFETIAAKFVTEFQINSEDSNAFRRWMKRGYFRERAPYWRGIYPALRLH